METDRVVPGIRAIGAVEVIGARLRHRQNERIAEMGVVELQELCRPCLRSRRMSFVRRPRRQTLQPLEWSITVDVRHANLTEISFFIQEILFSKIDELRLDSKDAV